MSYVYVIGSPGWLFRRMLIYDIVSSVGRCFFASVGGGTCRRLLHEDSHIRTHFVRSKTGLSGFVNTSLSVVDVDLSSLKAALLFLRSAELSDGCAVGICHGCACWRHQAAGMFLWPKKTNGIERRCKVLEIPHREEFD